MRFTMTLTIVILGVTSSPAMAAEPDCSALVNPQARQECMQHKYGSDVDCGKLVDPQARKECVEHKAGNGNAVQCSTLATEELREAVRQEKVELSVWSPSPAS